MRTVDALMVPRGFVLVLSDNLLCGSLETEETQESHFLSTFVLKILSIFLYAAPLFLSLHLCSCFFPLCARKVDPRITVVALHSGKYRAMVPSLGSAHVTMEGKSHVPLMHLGPFSFHIYGFMVSLQSITVIKSTFSATKYLTK